MDKEKIYFYTKMQAIKRIFSRVFTVRAGLFIFHAFNLIASYKSMLNNMVVAATCEEV